MTRWSRRAVLGAAPFAFAMTPRTVYAQTYPSRPITIIIGYTPGAVSDLAARTLAEGLRQEWGVSVIVDNRPGSGSNLAAGYVARAAPDGYTLMVGTDATMTSNVYLYRHTPFDPVKDFAPVINAGANIICLAVNAELPIKTVADVIAYARANPGKLTYGSSGTGSPHHLAGELLHQKTGIDIVHIPYKGGTLEALTRDVARAAPEAIAIICTNLRSAPSVEKLEHETGIPVYDTVATVVWKCLALAGVDPARVTGWGSLFRQAA